MHHLYPLAKGDPLCPLGFHPQVRWPTRCKRCFRDYKEHGGRKKEEDMTVSTPSLSTWNSGSRNREDRSPSVESSSTGGVRGWVSSQNLNQEPPREKTDTFTIGLGRGGASWTSTPDLGAAEDARAVTVSLTLPKKRPTPPDTGQKRPILAPITVETETQSVVVLRRPASTPPPSPPAHMLITKNDSLAERVRKMKALKEHNSFDKESSLERDSKTKEKPREKSMDKEKTPEIKVVKPPAVSKVSVKPSVKPSDSTKENDVNFLIKVKSARQNASRPPIRGGPTKEMVNGNKDKDYSDGESNQEDDNMSTAGTTTTETTLIDHNNFDYQEQIESLKEEVETLRKRCERVEKEKSDILLRRLASLDSGPAKTTGRPSESLKLQQKINELTVQNEDLKDEKKSLALRVRETEAELESRPSTEAAMRQAEQLRSKLLAAETLCEELMDENEDMKRELRSMEEEIEEMQDNFREDQADEYSTLRKELELTTKNCRVLSFKLKKTERKAEQLELEKKEHEKKLIELAGGPTGMDRIAKIKKLEADLAMSNEVAMRLQRELQEASTKLSTTTSSGPLTSGKRAPPLQAVGKSLSSDAKPSRASLTRGGSQEDPQQLLRDLQDSLEREADLREQLKNAEEEGASLRKKASRVEDDNESLVLQLKKMATKARSRKLSPTPPVNRLSVDHSVEKDEGISDEEDPAELRILLELNEQEASVLRRKVEELEHEGESMKTQLKELTDKLALSAVRPPTAAANNKKFTTSKAGNLSDEKVKVLEDELADLRKKLIEKERDIERLHAELSLTQKRSKGSLIKSKSLDGASEQQNVDLKRQLQLIEQEAAIMSARNQTLEQQQEALQAENKKLQLLSSTKTLKSEKSMEQSTEKISQLEAELQQAHTKIKELEKREGARAEDKPAEKKVTFLGAAAKKEAEALKAKTEELDKLKLTMKKVETERNTLSETLKLMKDDAIKSFRPRTPKKPTDLTTKLQMKKMVEELESEIGEMFVVMKNADIPNISQKNSEKDSLEKIIEDLKKKLTTTEKEVTTEKSKFQEEVTRWEKEKKVFTEQKVACETDNKSLKEQRAACERDNRSLVEQKTALEREKSKAVEEARKLDMQITKLNNELKEASGKQTAVSDLMKKIEELKSQMEDKDKQVEKMKKDLETAAKVEQDKNKLIKEVGDKTKKIADLEKKLKEAEDTCKRNDKMLTVRKERVSKLEKELSEDKEQMDNLTESLQHLSAEWSTEKEALLIRLGTAEEAMAKAVQETETKIAHTVQESEGKLAALEAQLTAKQTHIQQLEDMCGSVEGMTANAGAQVELATVREQLEVAQRKLKDGDKELASSKEAARSVETELKKSQEELGKIKEDLAKQGKEKKTMESKISELEIEFQAEKKRAERMKVIHEKDVKNKEIELAALKGKLRTLEQTSGAGSKKILDLKKEYDDKLKNMEAELAKEKKEYDELTGKYEILEEEHVITKAKLTIEKETVQGEMLGIQRDLNNASAELKSLQDTYNAKTDAWIKEKMELQDKLSSLEERLCGGGWEVEKARLLAKLEQRDKEVDHIGKERDVTNHLQEQLKREVEELRKKLDDYDRVTKVQRNLTLDNTSMEQEIKTLQGRLAQAEKVKKSDVADCKLRYEAQVTSIQDELVAQQGQVSRFKRERDMYKQMLEQAQKGMAELKAGGMDKNRNSVSSNDDSEEAKSRLLGLQQQVACLEDGLCEARLEASRVRTELVSERSTAEVKLAEMQSKLNEFEEERLVASGRTKIPGLRTRLELAWQKEREDQQRLLQETSTLARDLRQTLFEVERERDKEKLDMKRRIDQLKKTAEEETDENKKKVTELQCDLLELRDAHAKLRTTNEKLRREKERHDRDREQHKMSMAALKRSQQDEDRKISYLLELVEEVVKMSPDLMAKAPTTYMTPTPPRRNRSKSRSREATPEENSENSEMMLGGTLVKLQQVARDVRAAQITDRQKRQLNSRRAVSTEPRDTIVTTVTPRSSNGRVNSLKKRSISLEQTTHDQSKIWKTDDDSMSSMQSLDTDMDNRHYSMQRETSLDSRLSGGSTQSDVLPASDKKKKKGLFGKLKQLTKSRSIDDNAGPNDAALMHNEYSSVSQAGSDSDMSAAGSKRDLRGRLSDMFHRKGATNGSNTSVNKERKKELSTPVAGRSASLQRPLTRNGSATPTARLSPARSDSSNNSRAQSMTPGLLRKAKK